MKKIIPVTILVLSVCALFAGIEFQNGRDLFQQALSKERNEGDLTEAIRLYEQILGQFADNPEIGSRAQLRIGICYAKLGEKDATKAREAFEAVIENYPDQVEEVKLAKERLEEVSGSNEAVEFAVVGPRMNRLATEKDLPGFYGNVSRDGRYLSTVDWTNGDLAIFDTQTREKTILTSEGTWEEDDVQFGDSSVWSPDGARIAYMWFIGTTSQLRIVSIDGSKPRIIYQGAPSEFVPRDWSDDGKTIVGQLLVQEDGGQKEHEDHIAFISPEGGSIRTIKALGDRHARRLDLSPDGRFVLYDIQQEKGSDQNDIHIISADGKLEGELVSHPSNDHSPFWTPDGDAILFISDRLGNNGIWKLAVIDGKAADNPELILPIGDVSPLGLTDQGSLVTHMGKQLHNVYTAELSEPKGEIEAGTLIEVNSRAGTNSHPAWSPDGRYLAYFSALTTDHPVLMIRDFEGGADREVAIQSEEILRRGLKPRFKPAWTADSRAITTLGVAAEVNAQHLFKIDAESGEVSKAYSTDADHYITNHRWSRDGKTLYYLKNKLETWDVSIVALDLETGARTEIYRAPRPETITNIALSPDGKDLVFRSTDPKNAATRDILKIIPTEGGEPRILLDEAVKENFNISAGGGLDWTPDGKWIYFARWDGYPTDNRQLCRVSSKGGPSERIGEPFPFMTLSLSPEGTRIAYGTQQVASQSGIWVFTDLLSKK